MKEDRQRYNDAENIEQRNGKNILSNKGTMNIGIKKTYCLHTDVALLARKVCIFEFVGFQPYKFWLIGRSLDLIRLSDG
jgi:hypothetical protein